MVLSSGCMQVMGIRTARSERDYLVRKAAMPLKHWDCGTVLLGCNTTELEALG
jgi:hypothetical protein